MVEHVELIYLHQNQEEILVVVEVDSVAAVEVTVEAVEAIVEAVEVVSVEEEEEEEELSMKLKMLKKEI